MRLLILTLFLGGCAQTLAGANEAGGVVTGTGVTMPTKKAYEMAEAACAKYGKLARATGQSAWDGSLRYDCVAKPTN